MDFDPPRAVLDANVLFPFHIGHLLSFACFVGLLDGRWTIDIEREWVENAVLRYGEVERARIESRRDAMNAAVPWARVNDYQKHIERIAFQDPNDAHVIAAAIEANARFIVTKDKAFYAPSMQNLYGFSAIDPDDILVNILDAQPEAFVELIDKVLASLRASKPTIEGYAELLAASGLPRLAERLRKPPFTER
jgi:predicted nucleic acid-binding protein